jgi:hypothetical protein
LFWSLERKFMSCISPVGQNARQWFSSFFFVFLRCWSLK